jgi:adenosylcobinamide amidohydrolase
MFAELASRGEGEVDLDVLIYRFDTAMVGVSSAVVGGGIGEHHWALNAQVRSDYGREDTEEHIGALATHFSLGGPGVGMLTAAKVRRRERASDHGVEVEATVGLSHPTWAADEESEPATRMGTINLVVFVPVRFGDGALVNAVATVTEAKTQALFKAGVPATGTASDAVSIFCRLDGDVERFAGPRSQWGSRTARAAYKAVLSGARAGTT